MITRRLLSILFIFALSFSLSPGAQARISGFQQSDPAELQARELLAQMTTEERVGQLFLVSFKGNTAGTDSQIYDLIVNHHIGGVMLQANNDNIAAAPDTAQSVYQLIDQLQNAEWQASQPSAPSTNTTPGTPTPKWQVTPIPPHYIPLFIGISQGGDGYPNDQIMSGLTQLPSLMAIGATWDPTLAEQVGLVVGQELSALGFNFFTGPSLDVLESPDATLGNGLGANVFGGDPYWVGVMGSSYITGLHQGSNNRLVVIADHFPGRGSADRPAGEEPPTVRKGSDELKKIELAPFFAVTGNAQSTQSKADGLLVSHIRYQGFQGNIRSTTRPVSFDPQALSQILSLPPLAKWREGGGLVVSDDLGSPTVRSFYDPGKQSFLARLVARDAFLAGNDLLYMGNIVSSDAPDNYTSVIQTLSFFEQKYNEDSAFKKSVDDAVTRILMVKYHLYSYFSPSGVIPPVSGLDLLNQGQSQAVTSEVARQAATLVSPDGNDLDTVLPSPPGVRDQLVFLTDTRTQSQCSTCSQMPMMPVDALQNVITRLYGPNSGGQVMPGHMISYSFDSLGAILHGGTGNQTLEGSLSGASWVIISMLDAEPDETQTILLKRFLAERQDLLRDKHVIVFSFNAPYYLDSTEISELTAYYCLYSKSDQFVETAAKLLFRELSPAGILPVSVSGIGYDLLSATSPDPNQEIKLFVDMASTSPSGPAISTLSPTFTPSFKLGQTVSVRTGVIYDHNGHPVPDGTEVEFTIRNGGDASVVQQISALTTRGVASAPFTPAREGSLDITATSNPALKSEVLNFGVQNGSFSYSISTPTEINQPTLTPTVTPTPTPEPPKPANQSYPGMGGWFSMAALLSGLGYLAFWLGDRYLNKRWGVRGANCVILGGLLTYSYLAIRMPGATSYLQNNGWLGIVGIVLIGAILGAGGAFAWYWIVKESAKR